MRKPYVFKGKKPRQVEKAVFKSDRPYAEVLIERHGLERAIEIMEVRSEREFRRYCNRHGILEGGTKARNVYLEKFSVRE